MRQRQRVYGRKKKRARKREERVKKADIVEALGFVVALQQSDDEGARGVDAEGEEAVRATGPYSRWVLRRIEL